MKENDMNFGKIKAGDKIKVGYIDRWYVVESISSNRHGLNIYIDFPKWRTTHIHRIFITEHQAKKCEVCSK